jgi:hypothetical protein
MQRLFDEQFIFPYTGEQQMVQVSHHIINRLLPEARKKEEERRVKREEEERKRVEEEAKAAKEKEKTEAEAEAKAKAAAEVAAEAEAEPAVPSLTGAHPSSDVFGSDDIDMGEFGPLCSELTSSIRR